MNSGEDKVWVWERTCWPGCQPSEKYWAVTRGTKRTARVATFIIIVVVGGEEEEEEDEGRVQVVRIKY